jgi:hypothetical protein
VLCVKSSRDTLCAAFFFAFASFGFDFALTTIGLLFSVVRLDRAFVCFFAELSAIGVGLWLSWGSLRVSACC